MAKKRKRAETRPPVKVKGSLPAPKISPARLRVPWYRRRSFQILGGVLILGLVGLGVRQFFIFRDNIKKTAHEKRAVRSFERSLTLSEQTLRDVLQEMDTAPGQLVSGQMKVDDFNTKAGKWLADLRKIDQQLRQKKIPKRLDESRSLLLQGIVIFIDTTKVLQVAAKATEPAVRDAALDEARNLLEHAGAVYSTGRRALGIQKVRVGLAEKGQEKLLLDQPLPLPEETAQPRQPAPESPPGQPSPTPSGTAPPPSG